MDGRMTSPKPDSDFSRLSGNLVPGQLQTLVLQREYKMERALILTRLGKDANVYINNSEKDCPWLHKMPFVQFSEKVSILKLQVLNPIPVLSSSVF